SEAVETGVYSVCIPTAYLGELSPFLRNTGLKASTMVSFPTGLLPVEIKIMELRLAAYQDVENVYFYPNIGNYLDNRIVEFELELSRVLEESQLMGLNQIKPVVEAETVSETQISEVIGIFKTSGFDGVMLSFGFGLRRIRPEELNVLKSFLEHIALDVNCRIESLEEAKSLVEKGIRKICTVDYRVISKKVSNMRLD
ncbi:MAG: hypothetical protein QXU43_01405, partial [Thermoproteota archaeon]